MPSFIRPARVDVTENGGSGLALIVGVIAVCAAAAAVVSFVLSHLLLITACAAVLAGGTLGAVLAVRRYIVPRSARRALPTMESTRALPPAPLRAIQRPARALPPAQHLHLHFHGLDAVDLASVIGRQESPAQLLNGEE